MQTPNGWLRHTDDTFSLPRPAKPSSVPAPSARTPEPAKA